MTVITVIGRGHSGTRVMAHTLYTSGVYMGKEINPSGDKVPPERMYEACRVMSRYVKWKGGLNWDFTPLFTMPVDPAFERHIFHYLEDVLKKDAPLKGWKIPETTLVYPWITRLFPEAKFIHWYRDPRDCILGKHVSDNLTRFGIEHPQTDTIHERRAVSWLYQYKLMQATPPPRYMIKVRFEDFVLEQENTIRRLEAFLDTPLSRVVVRPEAVGRWRTAGDNDSGVHDMLQDVLRENGYTSSTSTTSTGKPDVEGA